MIRLDYSALTQPVTTADIAAYKLWRKGTDLYAMLFKPLAVVAAVFMIVIIILFFVAIATGNQPPYSLVISAVIGVVLVAAWRSANRQITAKRARLYKFAQANNIELLVASPAPTDSYIGMIFDEGDGRQINEGLRLPDNVEVGNYQYSTGSGKNRKLHLWGYAKVKLSRRLPHMVLDAKSNNFFGFTNLSDNFIGQETSLEGNFDKYFTLYVPKEYGADARYVFTPDFMAALIDIGSLYDIEIIDDQLYFYTNTVIQLDDEQSLQRLLSVVDTLSDELRDHSDHYSDDRVGNRQANIVAEPGRKLKKSINPATIALLIVILFYMALNALSRL